MNKCIIFFFLLSINVYADPARLVVLNKNDHTLVTVNTATLQVIGKISTGEGPHEVITSADGKTAFVANYGAKMPGNSLSIIDLESMREIKRVDLGPLYRPHGIAEAGGKIYFTSEMSRSVARYDPAAGRVDWVMGTGQSATHMLVLSSDQKKLFTTNIASDTVSVIALSGPPTPAGIVQIKVGRQPEALDITPDGKELWIGQNGDGKISIIDTATHEVKESFSVGQVPIRLKFTPDGKHVLVSDPKAGELIIVDVAKRAVSKRIEMKGAPLGIQLAPNGQRAYIARAQAGKVDVLDVGKLEIVGSVETGQGPDGLAWAKF